MNGENKRLATMALMSDEVLTTVSDEETMMLVRAGEVELLETLFNRYQGPLFNFFCKLTGDRGASEDLVQDVFFRILKYRETFKAGTPFRAWMYHIARNARNDRWRKQRPELDVEEVETLVSKQPSQAASLMQQQESELLHKALMQLPEEKRELLMLCRFQGLKYEEIGELLDCETGTVKVRVFRAIQDLKKIYLKLEKENTRGTSGMAM